MSCNNPSNENKNSLKFLDIFLGMVCILFFLDTAVPVASMGPTAIFWTLVIAVVFYIPSSLVVAELGSTYPEEGGMCAWVKRAYGKRWGARMVWLYWINNAIWISSLSTFIIGVFTSIFLPDASFRTQIMLTLVFVWFLIYVCLRPINEYKWMQNAAAAIKLVMVTGLIISAIIFLTRSGGIPANDFTTMFHPDFAQAMTYFPALVYNFIGFEVICAMGNRMKNPGKDVPRATISSAFIASSLYMTTTAVLLVIIPIKDLNLVTGILDAYTRVMGNGVIARGILFIIGCLFLYTLVTQAVSWIVGASRMAAKAAKDHELPAFFAVMHPKHDTPLGTLVISGCIGTILTATYGLLATSNEDLYWTLFSFTSMICLLPYVIDFQAFLKLRKSDTVTIRPYRFPGNYFAAVAFIRFAQSILLSSIFLFVWVPGLPFDWDGTWPLLAGVGLTLITGEYLTGRSIDRHTRTEEKSARKEQEKNSA